MPTTTITGTVLETADPGSPTLGAGKVVALPQDQSGNPLPKESRLAPVSATIASGSVSLSLPDAPGSVRWLIMVSPAAGTLRPYALASVAPGGIVTTATLRSSRKGGAMLPDAASVEALLASLPVDDARGGSVDIEALTETLSDSFVGVDDNLGLFVVRDGETIPVPTGETVFDSGTRNATGALGTRTIYRFGPLVFFSLTLVDIPADTYELDILPPGARPAVPAKFQATYAGETVAVYFEAANGTLYADDGFPVGLVISGTFPTSDAPVDPESLEAPF